MRLQAEDVQEVHLLVAHGDMRMCMICKGRGEGSGPVQHTIILGEWWGNGCLGQFARLPKSDREKLHAEALALLRRDAGIARKLLRLLQGFRLFRRPAA